MPSKKGGTRLRGVPSGADAPAWQVILEEIKSQNRGTIEAVESSRTALEQRIDRLDQESRARDAVLEGAIRHLGADLGRVDAKVTALDGKVTELDGKVAALDGKVTELDGKVAALDGKVTELDGKVTALDGKVTALDGKVTALDGKVTALDV
jgi:chromosome segregation ATPase